MELFHVCQPSYQSDRFWDACYIETRKERSNCVGCLRPEFRFDSPYAIEWTRDRWSGRSQVVGDFIWPCFGGLTVTDRVKVACELNGITGMSFHPVEAHSASSGKKAGKPFLVDAPAIWCCKPSDAVHLDLKKSGRKVIDECLVCGFIMCEVEPNASVVIVEANEYTLPDVFKVIEIPVLFCTGRLRNVIVESGFTNVEVKRRGVVEQVKGVETL